MPSEKEKMLRGELYRAWDPELTQERRRARDLTRAFNNSADAERVIARATAVAGDAALFAHGHVLRILTARWLGLPADGGRLFAMGTASVSTLGHERETRVITRWNLQASAGQALHAPASSRARSS